MRKTEQTCQRLADRRIITYMDLLNVAPRVFTGKDFVEYAPNALSTDFLIFDIPLRYYMEQRRRCDNDTIKFKRIIREEQQK